MIHLLHDDTLTQENREKFLRTVQKYSQEIEFVNVEAYKNNFSDELMDVLKHWTVGSLYRLLIPEILANLEKIIYLDCDVIVNMDIRELWEVDMNGKSLAGARDFPYSQKFMNRIRGKYLGINMRDYINSGVLLMNLRKIRECGLLYKIASDLIVSNRALIFAPDQDALNAIFCGDIEIISNRFNRILYGKFFPREYMSNCVIHACASKPWKILTGMESDRLYWKMFMRSAWSDCESCDEFIDKFYDNISSLTSSQFYHPRGIQCLKRILRSIWIRICAPFRLVKFFASSIFYRFKHK